MSIQIGEQLERRKDRARALALVPDRSSATAVEPVSRTALTEQQACASLGCSDECFGEHVRPRLRLVRSRGRRSL